PEAGARRGKRGSSRNPQRAHRRQDGPRRPAARGAARMNERRRAIATRVGITLLNFLVPGLGLLRIGQLRRAFLLYGVSIGGLMAFVAALASMRTISFAVYAASVAILVAAVFGALLTSMWLTWRTSRNVVEPRPVWSKWYSIVGAILLASGFNW